MQLVAAQMAERMPRAHMTEQLVRGEAPGLVRPLVGRERALRDRLAKYAATDIHRSVLLYGPPGSAKTTAACSIAESLVGSYIRVAAPCVSAERLDLLTQLAPKCVIVDDIDRHHSPDELLGMLDDLNRTVPLVFATANERTKIGAAQCRTGRLDIHVEMSELDPESFVEVSRTLRLSDIDLGPRGRELLASDLAEISERLRADDVPDGVSAVVDELLARRDIEYVARPAVPRVRTLECKASS
jgi:SpoVK/Ycf46/Vps4 family AAA+-type ATPase